MRKLFFLLVVLQTGGCATIHYSQTAPGELKGKLIVQWIDHDKFAFQPDKDNPLSFTRYNKDKITPGVMYTDGGSIPRSLWGVRNYSPWGYAPAFIVHDWLFQMRHCRIPDYEKYNVEEAAWIMSEIMKTMMEEKKSPDKLTLYAMFEAVRSPIAVRLWDNGTCEQPTMVPFAEDLPIKPSSSQPVLEYVIEFP